MILIIGPLPDPIDGCSFANKILCSNLDKYGIKYQVVNTNTQKISSKQGSDFSFLKAFYFLKVYFKIYKIFVSKVVYFTPGQTFYGILKYSPFSLFCIILRKPYVIHVHGNFLGTQYQLLKGLKKKIFYFLISKASAGIVLSETLKDNFRGLLLPEKVFVVENFAENNIYSNSNKLSKLTDIPRIIYLSNLMEEKGILDLLDGLILLDKKNINFKATIAGSIEKSIEQKIKDKFNILGDKLEYVGIIRGKKKKKALIDANIFILPTYYKMEGQPISIIEALATGNIIITTDHSGIPDIISNKNGYLINAKSAKSISEIILKINKNLKDEVETYSSFNYNYALNNFTEEKFSKKIIQVLNSVSQ